jgi:glycosyltransferase involved in cell wall biosynthesis
MKKKGIAGEIKQLPPILVVIGQLDIGGTERHLAAVLPKLAEHGIAITVLSLCGGGALQEAIEQAGICVHSPSPYLKRPFDLFFSGMLLVRLIRKLRPCIVHFYLPKAYLLGGLGSLPFSGCVRIMSRRSLNCYQLKHPYIAYVERWLHRRMDGLLANSRVVAEQLIAEGAPREKVGLLYNGIAIPDRNVNIARRTIRDQMKVGESAFVLVVNANLIAYKGHSDLIEALGKIKMKLPDEWMAIFVGHDNGIWQSLQERAERLGIRDNIRYAGLQDDVQPFLTIADLGVLPSHEEGFSNALLEYMAFGLSVIATNVGGNREIVIDQNTGLLVPARDPARLGAAILRLSNDPQLRNRLGYQAREHIERHFSLAKCVASYERLYHAVVSSEYDTVSEVLPRVG